jgi:hypothetical protein
VDLGAGELLGAGPAGGPGLWALSGSLAAYLLCAGFGFFVVLGMEHRALLCP